MNKNLTEKEIDDLVIAQADNDDAWEKPIFVNREKSVFNCAAGKNEHGCFERRANF